MTVPGSVRHILYVACLLAAVAAIAYWFEPLSRIWRSHGGTLMFAVVCMMASVMVQAGNFRVFLGCGPQRLRLWPLSRVWALTSLANYLGPLQPGVALRVAYLDRLGISWASSLLATWRQLSVSVWVSLGGCALGLLAGFPGDARLRMLALILAVTFVIAPFLRGLALRALRSATKPAWLAARRDMLTESLRGTTARGVAGVILQYAIGTVLLWVVYGAFGASVTWAHALLMACMVYVSSLVAVLPGNLGLLDAIYVVGGKAVGLPLPEAAALALLLRASQLLACGGLALAGPWPGRIQD